MENFIESKFIISKTVLFQSEIKSIELLEEFLEELNKRFFLNETVLSSIKTCLYEALTNAILHGNKDNVFKFVKLDFELIYQNCIVFKITDEGEGFNPEQLPDPTLSENLEKFGGRGVYIMRKLADFCIFNHIGNEVELYFKF